MNGERICLPFFPEKLTVFFNLNRNPPHFRMFGPANRGRPKKRKSKKLMTVAASKCGDSPVDRFLNDLSLFIHPTFPLYNRCLRASQQQMCVASLTEIRKLAFGRFETIPFHIKIWYPMFLRIVDRRINGIVDESEFYFLHFF